jgi:hypothetical protein
MASSEWVGIISLSQPELSATETCWVCLHIPGIKPQKYSDVAVRILISCSYIYLNLCYCCQYRCTTALNYL